MSLPEYEKGSLHTADGAQKPYVRIGRGPIPLVVIPGAGDGFRTAADVAIYLAWYYRPRCDEFRLLILSRREPIPRGFSINDHADDMIRTVEELGWGTTFWECLSAGGPIGQKIAVERPDLASGLVLSSGLHHSTGRTKRMLEQWLAMAEDPAGAAGLFSIIEQKHRPPPEVLSSAQLAETSAIKHRQYPDRLRHMLQALLDLDHRDLVSRIACPTLIVTGQDDRFVPCELQQDMARRIPHSRHEICAGFGHFHDLENPAYQELVSHFVKSTPVGKN
jgi:pimeloyl-ACP methyl ester carboxylesterase